MDYQKLFDELAKDRPAHNVFSPSGAKRWMACEGWYHATKDLPNKPSGPSAVKGTEIHELMEICIKTGNSPENLTEDTEYITHVGHVLDYVSKYKVIHPNAQIFTEVYIPFRKIEGFTTGGTIDVFGIVPDTELLIADLKTGGRFVDTEDNPQLKSYASAARLHIGRFPQYRIAIIQPALPRSGVVREVILTNEELDEFELAVEEAIINNVNDGERIPGEHCRYCKAEATCKPRAVYVLNQAGISLQEFIKDLDNG